MDSWPKVRGEFDTIRAVVAGKSLSRLGDGEIKHCDGRDGGRQTGCGGLKWEMRRVLREPHENLCVGIPTLDPQGPKFENWDRHRGRFLKQLVDGVQYYSAFVSRPDSAPWIYTAEFAELFQSVWAGKRASVVCKKGSKALNLVHMAAHSATHILCPHQNAYVIIDDIEHAIVRQEPDVAVLQCGPTATVLAHRLCKRGIQAVDIGSGVVPLLELLTGKLRDSSQASYEAWKKRNRK